ncbi:endonuclease/exonuclease/phosphatase family protein [uncultured Jatrophihabitans sp.]|uniref:endonuclease/exonuclease/phosphatase family protein n=1 Tax=uncultured Jatrophihabitans sp. TaxID=1610747 RepID=UPI0035C9B54A
MRIVSFNIASGRSPQDGRVDLDRFADAIATLDADVLCMQEVDRDQPRSGGADLTDIAATALRAEHSVFAPALYGTPGSRWTAAGDRPQIGPAYGCALISRLPLDEVQVLRIPAIPVAVPLWVPGAGVVVAREEPRVAIVARMDGALTVVGTHLPFVPGWKGRQLRRLTRLIEARPDPLLLLGDLNLRGGTPAKLTGYRSLVSGLTFPSSRPRFQLDHILLRGRLDDLGSVTGAATPRLAMSDHRPVVVDVDQR